MTQAEESGYNDALTFMSENVREDWENCLKPGQEDPDWSLICALGHDQAARELGVKHPRLVNGDNSPEAEQAFREYNEGFLNAIRDALTAYNATADALSGKH